MDLSEEWDLIPRDHYLDKLWMSRDTRFVKVLTGIRRCGKSSIMKMFLRRLIDSGIGEDRILYIDFDVDPEDKPQDHTGLTRYVESRLEVGRGSYILLDEVQNVEGWDVSVSSFYAKGADVYITGSNSKLLSSEMSSKLSGRGIDIEILPLSFSEYVRFRGGDDTGRLFGEYVRYGGLPAIAMLLNANAKQLVGDAIDFAYQTVYIKDIVERHQIRDAAVLSNIIRFTMLNIGNRISTRNIAGYLTSKGQKISHVSVENYLGYLEEAHLVSRPGRIDAETKDILSTHDKLYATDLGMRNRLCSFKEEDIDGILENIVYNELRRRYDTVDICSMNDKEVDFIADANGTPSYFQVSTDISDKKTRERELRPLRAIGDNYPKYVITYDRFLLDDIDGIRIMTVMDWLLEDRRS